MLTDSQASALAALGMTPWALRPAQPHWYLVSGKYQQARLALLLCEPSWKPDFLEAATRLQAALAADAILLETRGDLSFPMVSDKLAPTTQLLAFGASQAGFRFCHANQIVARTLPLSTVGDDINLKRQVWQDVKHHKL